VSPGPRTPGFRGWPRSGLIALVILLGAPPGFGESPGFGTHRPAQLASVLGEGEPASRVAEAIARGPEIFALDRQESLELRRWLRAGGRLWLEGAGADAAARLIVRSGESRAEGLYPTGLGEIAILRAADVVPSVARPCDREQLVGAAAKLARSHLPKPGRPPLAPGLRLAAYALLLGLGYRLARNYSVTWRAAGAASLIVVFGIWPLVGSRAPWAGDRVAQVDVVVQPDEGAQIVWSAAALRAGSRRSARVVAGSRAWGLHTPEGRGLSGSGFRTKTRIDPTSGSFTADVVRGGEVLMAWMAEGVPRAQVGAEVALRGGRVTALVRNGGDLPWTEVWLLLPDMAPIPLDDLPPFGALLLEREEAILRVGSAESERFGRLPLARLRLLEAALECAVKPLHARRMPVVLAWTDGAVRPATTGDGATPQRGSTLLIAAGRSPS